MVARRITPDRILGAQPPPQPARAIPVRRAPAPQLDTAAIQRQFEQIKKRWGMSDVSLQFSGAPLWISKPGLDDLGRRTPGQQAAAWYEDGSKTIVFSLPVLKRVYSDIPKGGAAQQYKGGLDDALLVYATGVLDHELAHGLQGQEEAGQRKRQEEFGGLPKNPPEGWPHDPRQIQRTNVLNKAELLPLMGRLRQQRLQEDDPTFQKAPELLPMFFGNNPRPRLPLQPISPLGPTGIGGRGGT